MSDDFERLLKETLDDLAGTGRPVSLAEPALRQGRRIVARRRGFVAAVAVAAIAAVVVPFAVFNSLASGEQQPFQSAGSQQPNNSSMESVEPLAHPTPTLMTQPVTLPGNWMLAAAGSSKGSGTMLWDRTRRKYRLVPYSGAVPAPVGTQVAIHRTVTGGVGIGILDLRTDRVQWVAGPVAESSRVEWSTDGSRLTYAGRVGTSDTVRVVVVSAENAAARTLSSGVPCAPLICVPQWLPGDNEIGMSQVMADGTWRFRVLSSTDGRTDSELSLPGAVLSARSWSLDRKYVVVREDGYGSASVVDAATGQVTKRLGDIGSDVQSMKQSGRPAMTPGIGFHTERLYWATADRLLSVENSAITQYSLTGYRLDIFPFPSWAGTSEAYDAILTPIG